MRFAFGESKMAHGPLQFIDIGFQSAQYILDSANPLATFARVVHDFPKYAHILATFPTNKSFKAEAQGNARQLQRSTSLWLNGMEQDLERLDAFRYR